MYEKTGLGWSEPSASWLSRLMFGPLADTHAGSCDIEHDELTREVCFEPGEESIAQGSGCIQRFKTLTGNEIGCATDSGNNGKLYCCRPTYPRPYYEPSTSPGGAPEIPTPAIPEFSPPTGGERATFFTKLMHPGSLIAIGLFSVAGVLVYHNWKGTR